MKSTMTVGMPPDHNNKQPSYLSIPSWSPCPSSQMKVTDMEVTIDNGDGATTASPKSPKTGYGCHDRSSPSWSWLWSWSWEILACFLSFVSLLAIFLTLHFYNGQAFPRWPLGISINALLSLYTAIYRAAVFYVLASCVGQLQWAWFSNGPPRPLSHAVDYDEATRGPWGALILIWTQRLRQPLAILAAVIAVSSVIVDAFIQGLANPSDCSVAVHGLTPRVPLANVLGGKYRYSTLDSYKNLTLLTQAALYGSMPKLEVQCATGNCTFDETYGTLAFCSSCQDVSSQMEFSCVDPTTDVSNAGPWHPHDWEGSCDPQQTLSRIPGGISMRYQDVDTGLAPPMHGPNHEWGGKFTYADTDMFRIRRTDRSSYWTDDRARAEMQFIAGRTYFSSHGVPIDGDSNNTCSRQPDWNSACGALGAVSCALEPCVRLYKGSVLSGEFVEKLVAQSDVEIKIPANRQKQPTWNPNLDHHIGLVDLKCIPAWSQAELDSRRAMMDYEGEGRWARYYFPQSSIKSHGHGPNLDEFERTLVERQCLYVIQFGTGSSTLLDHLAVIEGKVTAPISRENNIDKPDWVDIGTYGGGRADGGYKGPVGPVSIYNEGQVDFHRIQKVMNQIADATTHWIRTHGDAGFSNGPPGRTLHYATCLAVQWEWIAFPAVLAVLTLALLISVIVVTSRQNLPVWKYSLLSWLLRGPGAETYVGLTHDSNQFYRNVKHHDQHHQYDEEEEKHDGDDENEGDKGRRVQTDHMTRTSRRIFIHLPDKTDPIIHIATRQDEDD